MSGPFLTACWMNLGILSYHVPRELVDPLLPPGLELDTPPGTPEGMGLVSLVAFEFLDTRVLGIRWPGCAKFPEVNLRFYARQPMDAGSAYRRGVVFVRELVPRRAVSLVARAVYNEPYVTVPMRSEIRRNHEEIVAEYRLGGKRGDKAGTILVRAAAASFTPAPESPEHWIKEQHWGFGRSRRGNLLVYEVRHPVWAVHRVLDFRLDFDWQTFYGHNWEILNNATPASVLFAEGSQVEVDPKRIRKV